MSTESFICLDGDQVNQIVSDHHPEITYGYSNLSIKFFTYAIDGLSENDFICAAKIDKLMKC